MRAVIYARYSSDLQNSTSTENQIAACKTFIKEKGWSQGKAYFDNGISGRTIHQRPDFKSLLKDSDENQFDIVVALHSDRLSRDTADMATIYRDFKYHGIQIWTVHEGHLNDGLLVSVRGAMNEHYSIELGKKTKLGQHGRVAKGKKAGGNAFGYKVVPPIWVGKVMERGDREIIDDEAAIVKRIFKEYASGLSPRNIASRLNHERTAGPGGRNWVDTTIRGQITRGTGILNNFNYIGINAWDKCSYVTDPRTGKKKARPNPQSEWVMEPQEKWRIIPDELWEAVKQRQKENTTEMPRVGGVALNRLHRKKHLLSGLVVCGFCGGNMAINNGPVYSCSNKRRKGTCNSKITVGREALEQRVLYGIKQGMLGLEYVEIFKREFEQELATRNDRIDPKLKSTNKALKIIEIQLVNLVGALKDGNSSPSIIAEIERLECKLAQLEKEKIELEKSIGTLSELTIEVPKIYRLAVDRLHEGFDDPASKCKAMEILRSMIDHIIVGGDDDPEKITLSGDAGILIENIQTLKAENPDHDDGSGLSMLSVVAGVGFEPTTFRL